jgi:hypothetical protein
MVHNRVVRVSVFETCRMEFEIFPTVSTHRLRMKKKCDTILAGILYGHIVSAVCLVHPFCSPRSRRFLITRPSRFFLFLPDSEYKYVDEGCVIVETCVSLMNYRQEMA